MVVRGFRVSQWSRLRLRQVEHTPLAHVGVHCGSWLGKAAERRMPNATVSPVPSATRGGTSGTMYFHGAVGLSWSRWFGARLSLYSHGLFDRLLCIGDLSRRSSICCGRSFSQHLGKRWGEVAFGS